MLWRLFPEANRWQYALYLCVRVCVSLYNLQQCTAMRNSGANVDSSQRLLCKHIINHYHNTTHH